VNSTGNMLTKNLVRGAGDDGFDLDDGLNTLTKNKARKSGGYDLEVGVSPDTNIYKNNNFKTESP